MKNQIHQLHAKMFDVPGAKKYDFSGFNFYIVSAVLLLICYLGNKNTYFNQFYRVNQLPENRTELSILKSYDINLKGSQIFINLTIDYIFSITLENFLRSFSLEIQQYGFISIHKRNNFIDFKIDGNKISFFTISSIYGDLNISLKYLNTTISKQSFNIKGISLLYPGSTLLSKSQNRIHFTNVFYTENMTLGLHFVSPFTMDPNFIRFPHFRTIPAIHLPKNAKEQCQVSICRSFDNDVHLFSAPAQSVFNPYYLFLSLSNPITDFLERNPKAMFAIYGYKVKHPLINNIAESFGDKVMLLDPTSRVYFKELNIEFHTSRSFDSYLKVILGDEINQAVNDNKIVILNSNHLQPEKEKKIVETVCGDEHQCEYEVLPFDFSRETIRKINQAKYLVTDMDNAYYMFALQKNSKVLLISNKLDQQHQWILSLAKDLKLEDVKLLNDKFTVLSI